MPNPHPMNDWQLTKHFNLRDFQCKHCATVRIQTPLVEALEAAAATLGAPVTIVRAYSCTVDIEKTGDMATSRHQYGAAATLLTSTDHWQELLTILKSNPDLDVEDHGETIHVELLDYNLSV